MYFYNFVITLLIVILASGINTFRFYGFGNGFRYLTKLLAINAASFDTSSIETKWIEQPLDHFNQSEHRMWKMRYFENLEFWKPNSTIYVFIGGEGEASPFFLTSGTLYELANETNGAMFGSEHRYYGKSMPLDNKVLENLKYLSSRQALADLAYFIKSIKTSTKFKESTSSKVVVIGGSYPGNLAAWMRLLYPDLIDAAIASSAPVLAKKDFYEYLETVSDDYEQQGSEGCHDKIQEIFNQYEQLLKTNEGINQLKGDEKICEDVDMTKPENKQLFFLEKASEFMWRAQYGNPNQIKKHCSKIMKSSRVTTTKFEFEDNLHIWREERNCYDYDFYNMIDETKKIDWVISWVYQTCTEFGYYQTSDSDNQPFTRNIPAELYYKMCAGMFGQEYNESKIDEGVNSTNDFFGGLNPNVTHVVFVNGDMDPWSRLGILEDVSYDAPAKVIPRSSHCRDLLPKKQDDPDELVEVRMYVKYLIKKWLNIGEYKSQ